MFQVLIFSLVMGYAVSQSMDGGNVTSMPVTNTTVMPVADSTSMPENITTSMPVNTTTSMPVSNTTNTTALPTTTATSAPTQPPTTPQGNTCYRRSDCPRDHCCYMDRSTNLNPFFRWRLWRFFAPPSGVCRPYQQYGQPCDVGGCGCAPELECVYWEIPFNTWSDDFRGRFGRRRGICMRD